MRLASVDARASQQADTATTSDDLALVGCNATLGSAGWWLTDEATQARSCHEGPTSIRRRTGARSSLGLRPDARRSNPTTPSRSVDSGAHGPVRRAPPNIVGLAQTYDLRLLMKRPDRRAA